MKKDLTKQQLEELVHSLSWNESFGCYNRTGFETLAWPEIADQARWIIFFDVDDMHRINSEFGYEKVNTIIKDSLAIRSSDVMAGQWFSGDEFIIVITDAPGRRESNPIEFCSRLAETFRSYGTSATFAIAPVVSKNLCENVRPAQELCMLAKAGNRRGSINIVDAAS